MCGGSVSRKARRAAPRSEAVPAGTAGRRAVPPTYKGGGIVAGTRGRLSAWYLRGWRCCAPSFKNFIGYTGCLFSIRIIVSMVVRVCGVVALVGAVLAGCGAPSEGVAYRRLFSLDIGLSENKVALFQFQNSSPQRGVFVGMRDGLVSVSVPAQNKVVTFTSYGDVMRFIYQPSLNPEPFYVAATSEEGVVQNRVATAYDFYQTSRIAMGENNEIFVVDQLPPDLTIFDEDSGVLYDRVVVRFDARGRMVHSIGQEGVGGTPFPAIRDIFVVHGNDVVVVCDQGDWWQIFWFGGNGVVRYRVDIDSAHLPSLVRPSDITELERVVPDPTLPRLYLKVDFYNEHGDSGGAVQYGIEQVASRIYWMNLPVGRYTGYIDIPSDFSDLNGERTTEGRYTVPYDFLGVARGEYIVLWGHLLNQRPYLLVVGTDSDVVLRHEIKEAPAGVLFSDFTLSPSGVVAGLHGYHDRVDAVWWRLDTFLKSL